MAAGMEESPGTDRGTGALFPQALKSPRYSEDQGRKERVWCQSHQGREAVGVEAWLCGED